MSPPASLVSPYFMASFHVDTYRMIASARQEVLPSQTTTLLLCFLKTNSLAPPCLPLMQTRNCYYISPQILYTREAQQAFTTTWSKPVICIPRKMKATQAETAIY